MKDLYLTQKFNEIYKDISPKSREQCLRLGYTYLGMASEGSLKGFKLRTLDNLLVRKEKGDQIIDQTYRNPEISVEAKTAMDIIRSAFIEYTNSIESQVDPWREKHPQEATRSLYELSMVYQGREFNGEKSPRLASIEDRYRRANQIILKHARKDITLEKLRAIKDLAKRFTEYEQKSISPEKYGHALREKNKEAVYTLERFAEYHKIIKKPIKQKLQKQSNQSCTTSVLNMPVGEAAKKIWNTTKKILLKQIF